MRYDAVIIGGGAAGLFCAATAASHGKRVVVLEHNREVGRKILISGGGRCNFTNVGTTPENFISENRHFAKSALAGFTPGDFIAIVRRHGIAYYEKKLGQLFCRDNSRAIVDMLVAECEQAHASIRTGIQVEAVEKKEHGFSITANGRPIECTNVVIACGGLSFPKIGASDFGYRVAGQFGHRIVETRPSLVALVRERRGHSALAGVALTTVVTAGRYQFEENSLFTHRGMSGPAILQASNYWSPKEPVEIDLMPGIDLENELANSSGKQSVRTVLERSLPNRLAAFIADEMSLEMNVADLSRNDMARLIDRIKSWRVSFVDTEGYDRAEVTIGGVDTNELSSTTMESRRVKGLYFIGEVVDVTGWLGGYNFQWAWASGYAAGKAIQK